MRKALFNGYLVGYNCVVEKVPEIMSPSGGGAFCCCPHHVYLVYLVS